jgi:putative SOS response-associated peptidase YedK
MCGRYTITRQKGLVEELEAVLDPNVTQNQWWKARFNVAPTQDAPVVTLRDGVRTLEMMRWGLVPFWAGRDGSKPPLMINARVETLKQKPMFRDALSRGRRCLVPADGFFEWKKGPKAKSPKQPMWIHPHDHRFFAFAGLWARNKGEGTETHSFTIVTGPPNDLVAPIHDRMPVILSRAAWAKWLDPSLSTDDALALLAVPPVDDWEAEPVSTAVNVATNDDESCIAPFSAPAPEPSKQGSLF